MPSDPLETSAPSASGALRVVAEKSTATVELDDHVLMHVRIVRPPAVESSSTDQRRVLILSHGGLEHGVYYERLARTACARGWEVVIPDHRGHGLTAGPRIHVDHFDQYLTDLDRLVTSCGTDPARTALFGHSMGGLIAARYAQTHAARLAALVLSAPLFKAALPINPFVLAFGRVLARIAPRTRFNTGIRPADLSRNPDYLARRAVDPLVEHRVTAAWYVACEQAMLAAMTGIQYPGPTLLLQGTGDRIVDPETNLAWARRIGAESCELPDQMHALLQEPEGNETQARILDWLERHVPSVPRRSPT